MRWTRWEVVSGVQTVAHLRENCLSYPEAVLSFGMPAPTVRLTLPAPLLLDDSTKAATTARCF